MDPVLVRGVLAFVIASAVFFGSIWLLLAMILGARLGYWVMGSTLFGILILLAIIWFGTGLGPKGPDTTWHSAAVGLDLSSVEQAGEAYDVSDYPGGSWQEPQKGRYLADLKGGNDTATEVSNVKPVMEAFVGDAVSEIEGKRTAVARLVKGPVQLEPGKFQITDVRMKEADVEGKPSVIAVARAVPAETVVAGSLGAAPEGKVERYLVKAGDTVSEGQAILVARTDSGSVEVSASGRGKVVSLGLRPGDRVIQGAPIAVLDVSGQPGTPAPVEVAAVRVRGAVRTPALYYLLASLALFAVHMVGLSRAERARQAQPQTA